MGDPFDRRDQRKAEKAARKAAKDEKQLAAYEAWWVKGNRTIITKIEHVGHQPGFSTDTSSDGNAEFMRTTMRCERCGEEFRPLLHRWRGLSPNRPCPGEPVT